MASWAIIKFPLEQDKVAAVPTSWLRGNQCLWPPWTSERMNSAIQNCVLPEETWQLYPFTPLRNNIFADFKKAKEKMETATVTSDLESARESESEVGTHKKRKVIKTAMTRYSSFNVMSECENDSASEDISILPELPALKEGKSGRSSYDTTGVVSEPPKFRGGSQAHSQGGKSRGSQGTETSALAAAPFNSKEKPIDKPGEDYNKLDDVINDANYVPMAVQPQESSLDMTQLKEYLQKIIRKQNIIQSTLVDLAEDISDIRNKIGHHSTDGAEDSESIFTSVNLPVNSPADLETLENHLNTDAAMTSAVKEIASSGGRTVYDFIYRATQKLVTNKFASGYSYFGRQKKMRFSSLKLNALLKKSAMKNFNSASEKDAEEAVAKWLRRCTERAKKEVVQDIVML